VDADADTWLAITRGEKNPVWAVLTRKLRIKGAVRDLKTFQRCFPV
jgi:putative sterol carrier protein